MSTTQRRRTYKSALRAEQEGLTRGRIMAAVADLVQDGRIHTFTVEEVARVAGVSYASVYRHYPSREQLVEGLYEWLQTRADAPRLPDTLDQLPEWIERLVAYFEEHGTLAHASAMAATAMGLRPASALERDDVMHRLVAAAASDLPPNVLRSRAAVARYLVSSLAWATLRFRFGLDRDSVASSLRWALEALVRDLRRVEERRSSEG